MNQYRVIKAFGNRAAGEIITVDSAIGKKLVKQGLVTLADEYVEKLVDMRWKNECLEIYNTQTGFVLLRIPGGGLTSLTLDITGDLNGDVTGDLTGNVTGDVTGDLTGDVTGNVQGNVTGDLTGRLFGDVTTYNTDGAIALTDLVALLDGSASTCAMTLADGTEGQITTIKTVDVTNACTITPTNLMDGASISLPAAKDAVTLVFDGTDWQVINLKGTAAVVA